MSYTEKVLSRLLTPGTAILLLGAVIGFSAGAIAGKLFKEKERGRLILQAAGLVIALIGALVVFAQ